MIDAEDFDRSENVSLQEQLEWFDSGDYFEVVGKVYRVDGSRYVQVDAATLDEIGERSYSRNELLDQIPENEVLSPYGLDSNGVLTSYAWMEEAEEEEKSVLESDVADEIRREVTRLLQQEQRLQDGGAQRYPGEPPEFSLN